MSEMNRQRDASQSRGGGRSATSPDRNLVLNVNAQRRDLAVLRFEHFAISCDDEVIFHAAADLRVAAFRGNKEVRRPFGAQTEVEVEGKSGGVKGRPQIRGGRWER